MDSEFIACRICLKPDTNKSFLPIFPNRSELATQIQLISTVKIQDKKAVICHACLKRLKAATRLRNECIKAEKWFNAINGEFLIEVEIKEPKQKFQCTNCSKFFSNLYYLKQHEIALHTSVKPENLHECDSCGFKSKTKSLMRSHQLNFHCNLEEKSKAKFQCRYCGRISNSLGALYAHEKTHREVPLDDYLCCKLCDKKFKEKRLLKNHVQLVHEKSLIKKCSNCDFVATCAGSLSKHVKAVHLKLKNFVCDECNKRFVTNQQLLRHQRSHRGQKPFKCLNENCEKFFADSHGRKRHLKICNIQL